MDAFRRAAGLDSGTAPLGHLLELAMLDGDDTAAVRRLGALYLARDASGELLGFYQWRMAAGLHDERALAALRSRYRQMPLGSLWRIMNYAVLDGRRLEDADSAAVAIRAQAGRSSDWQRSKTYLHAFEINRGRPVAALADTAAPTKSSTRLTLRLYQRVLDALYGDGDSVDGGKAAGSWPVRRSVRTQSERCESGGADGLCVATLWRLSRGELMARARPSDGSGPLRRTTPPESRRSNTICTALLEAKLAAAAAVAGGTTALDRLDSLMRSGPGGQRNGPPVSFTLSPAYVRSMVGVSPVGFEDFANLEVARLRERQGNNRAALAAVRRRPYAYHLTDYLPRTFARKAGWPPSRATGQVPSGPISTTWRCDRIRSRRCDQRSKRCSRIGKADRKPLTQSFKRRLVPPGPVPSSSGDSTLERPGFRTGASGSGRPDALSRFPRILLLPYRQSGSGRRGAVRPPGDGAGYAWPPRCQLDDGPGMAPDQPCQAVEAEPGDARCQHRGGLRFPLDHDME